MRIPINWLKDYVDITIPPKELAQKLTLAGHALDKPLYEQEGDTVLDLEDRGNRADVTGILGIARDLAALTGQKLEYPKLAAIPKVDNEKFIPKISVESKRVIRWRAVNFKNIKVGPSPAEIQKRLKVYGIEVINNIVDITNYIMIEYGVPIHAFDLDKVNRITLRQAKKGEKLITFEGGELEFDENDLLAADDGKPLTLTTAVGGRESGISLSTKNVLIEAGLYDQPTARRSALRLNVRNETAGRLGKYLHPELCEVAIARVVELMKEVLGTEPEPVSFDYYPNPYPVVKVNLTQERLDLVAGEHIELSEAEKILKSLEFEIVPPSRHSGRSPESVVDPGVAPLPRMTRERVNESITVKVPYFRTDVTMEDDVIEEVLRIRGYDKIPVYLPNRPAPKKLEFPERDLENQATDVLVKLGFNEVVSQQIIDEKDSRKTGLFKEEKAVRLENSWNEELNIMRPETLSGQLKYALSYQKHNASQIRIFEVGKSYTKTGTGSGLERYKETRKVAVTANVDFLSFKSFMVTFLTELGVFGASWEKEKLIIYKDQRGVILRIGGDEIGEVGELKQALLGNFGLTGTWCHACFYTINLLRYVIKDYVPKIEMQMKNYVSEDATYTVETTIEVTKILDYLKNKLDPSTKIIFMGVFESEELKKTGNKNVSFNFKFDPIIANTESEKIKYVKLS